MYQINAELPGYVRTVLPEAAQTRFRQAANVELTKKCSEKTAIRKAWLVVKAGWEKHPNKWIRKDGVVVGSAPGDQPTPSTSNIQGPIHNNVPLGSDKRKKNKKNKKDNSENMNPEGEDLTAYAKAAPRTLYVCRYVQNAKEILAWAKDAGFKTTLTPADLHVTIAHSKMPVDWMKMGEPENDDDGDESPDGTLTVAPGGPRLVEPLGDKGAVVLLFSNDDLAERNAELQANGAVWDFVEYQPHITITWDAQGLDLTTVKPYSGAIVLGPEIFTEIDNNWSDNITEKRLYLFQAAGLIAKTGNPYHDNVGRFTTGSGEGGISHITEAHARVGGQVSASHVSGDWMDNSVNARQSADSMKHNIAVNVHLHQDPKQFHSTTARVAKAIGGALVQAGIDAVIGVALAKGIKVLMPYLSGPAKNVAQAAATFGLTKIATSTGATPSALRSILANAVKAAAGAKLRGMFGFAKFDPTNGPGTVDDLVTFQLQRLQTILEDMDPTDISAQRAEALLQSKDPVLLQRMISDLEDAGFTDYDTTVGDNTYADARVVKVDAGLGLVFGWAVVCKHGGQDYYDKNIDRGTGERVPEHIPEGAMLEAAADFMENSRVAKDMHSLTGVEDAQGSVVFAFPMTTDIAKSLKIETPTTGLLIAMKPSPELLSKFVSGEYKGFSVGGSRIKSRETAE